MVKKNSLPRQISNSKSHNLEDKLRESETFFRHLAELTPEAIVIHAKGKIIYANPSAIKLVKAKDAHNLIGHPIMDFVHPDSRKIVADRVKMMLTNKKVAPIIEEKFLALDGSVLTAEVKAVPFILGNDPTILTILHDITESREIKERLEQSEKRFRALIEHSSDAIALLSTAGKILYISTSIEKMLGYSPENSIGKDSLSFVYPGDRQAVIKTLKKFVHQSNSSITADVRVRHKNGAWIWIECTGTNMLNLPHINAIAVNFKNIQDKKIAEQRQEFIKKASDILISSIDYKKTLQNIAHIVVPTLADYCRIVVVDEEGHACEVAAKHANPKRVKYVKTLYSNYKENDSATHGIDRLLKTGKSELIHEITTEILEQYKDNQGLVSAINSLGLKSYMGIPLKARGKTIGAMTFSSIRSDRLYTNDDLLFAQDLAHRIALALDNARLFLSANNAIILRDDFISVASHELKTPLTSLKMYTQVLERKFEQRGDEETLNYFKRISGQINKLSALAGDLLNASKLQHGKLEFQMETVDLDEIVADTVNAIQATDRKHIIKIEGSINKIVHADRYRIYQVLTNLLTNAIKYSPESDKIVVALKAEKTDAVIEVKDFGIGIDRVHQKKIFNQFYRVASPEEKTYPGLGMGLYISHEIVRRHGGRLWVESERNKGSSFIFSLPLKK